MNNIRNSTEPLSQTRTYRAIFKFVCQHDKMKHIIYDLRSIFFLFKIRGEKNFSNIETINQKKKVSN